MCNLANLLRLCCFGTLFSYVVLVADHNSHLQFTATPGKVKPPVTPSLVLRCSLWENPSTSSLALAATSESHHSSAFDDTASGRNNAVYLTPDEYVKHVSSITISKGKVPVATVSQYTPATAEPGIADASLVVTGDVSMTSGELGYLELVWSFPTESQTGEFQCSSTGLTSLGHGVSTSRSVVVYSGEVGMEDVLTEIKHLKQIVSDQNDTLNQQKETISLQQANIFQQGITINSHQLTIDQLETKMAAEEAEITALNITINEHEGRINKHQSTIDQHETEIAAQQADINNLKIGLAEAQHVETGSLRCVDSAYWPVAHTPRNLYNGWGFFDVEMKVSQAFKSAYSKPPIVFLSANYLSILTTTQKNTFYAIQVMSVDTLGFILRCGSGNGNEWRLKYMGVDWIAIPQV